MSVIRVSHMETAVLQCGDNIEMLQEYGLGSMTSCLEKYKPKIVLHTF